MDKEPYDSRQDTVDHIWKVGMHLSKLCGALQVRAQDHDLSKLEEPEKSVFDEVTPRLKKLTYGSDEYNASLKEMGVALDHHYAKNAHHPEHHKDGIYGMTLVDLIEMLCDWAAATERHEDGDIIRSLKINSGRFKMTGQLARILENTVREYGIGKGL